MTTAEMVAAVRAHALEHYEEGGWDFVVECYEDADILEAIQTHARHACGHPAVTAEDAIRAVGFIVGIMEEQRRAACELGGICYVCHSAEHTTENHPK